MVKLYNFIIFKGKDGIIRIVERNENELLITELTIPKKLHSGCELNEFKWNGKGLQELKDGDKAASLPRVVGVLFDYAILGKDGLCVNLSKDGLKALKLAQEEYTDIEFDRMSAPFGIMRIHSNSVNLELKMVDCVKEYECQSEIEGEKFVNDGIVFEFVDKPINIIDYVLIKRGDIIAKERKLKKPERINKIFSDLSETELTKEQKELLLNLVKEVGTVNPFDVQEIQPVHAFETCDN